MTMLYQTKFDFVFVHGKNLMRIMALNKLVPWFSLVFAKFM